MFNIQEELKKLPEQPGVYLMKDSTDNIIYVGKAKILKNRVKSYFQSNSGHNAKTLELVSNIVSFEYIVTDSEINALILECNLIKKHNPKYNIKLKDSSGYPYIKINTSEKYPRVYVTREYKKDHNKYFGPYVSGLAVYEVMDLIHKTWQTRHCHKIFPRDIGKDRPCLNYHIKKCQAPCRGNVTEEEYMDNIKEIIAFLNGDNKEIVDRLTKEMMNYSENLEFERAGELRDKILSIQKISEKQNMNNDNTNDIDIIGLARDGEIAIIQIFYIRNGLMLGRDQFTLTDTSHLSRNEVLHEFVKQYYKDTTYVPAEILLESEITDETILEWLNYLRGSKVSVKVPQKGDKKKYLKMAQDNASLSLIQFGENLVKELKRTVGALDELREYIGTENSLNRIEAYDISNVQGYESVGSMIVFDNGKPKREDYRKFKIKTIVGPDDYGSMHEVITRRFNRYIKEQNEDVKNKKFSTFPDALFIDGGKGQVSSVKKALAEIGIHDLLVVGMIKDDSHRTRGLLVDGKEIEMKKSSEAFKLLTRIQDEVHRFALEYHKTLRKKTHIRSVLDDIDGVGEARRNALIKHFGSVEKIRTATMEDLMQVTGMNVKVAENILSFLGKINNKGKEKS